MESFEIESVIKGEKPKEIYDTWVDAKYHGVMTGSTSIGSQGKSGDKFTAWNGFIQGETEEAKSGKYLKQKWRTLNFKESDPSSSLEIFFEAHKDGTHIKIKHSNIPKGQGNDYKTGWNDRYFKPMSAYFSKDSFEAHVHPHDAAFEKVADNLWTIGGYFPSAAGDSNRTMTVYKMTNGKLWIHGSSALTPALMAELDKLGEVDIIVAPCAFHRADCGVYHKRYPNAKVYAPSGLAVTETSKVTKVTSSCEDAAKSWVELGIHVLTPPGLKNNFELVYQLDLANNGAALVFCDLVHHHPDIAPGPPSFLFGSELGVIRAAVLPGIGFVKDAKKFQHFLFDLCDALDPKLSAFKGKRLDAITLIHGCPVHHQGKYFQDALWILRNKIAVGAHMPENLGRGNPYNEKDVVKQGYLEKSDPKGGHWKNRYCVLLKDGRLVYYTDKGKDARGVADLHGGKAELAPNDKKPFAFNISYPARPESRKFFFTTVSAEESKDWVEKINSIVISTNSKYDALKRNVSEVQAAHTADANEDPQIGEIFGYWFQAVDSDDTELTFAKHAAFWFMRNDHVDELIRSNFQATWEKAVKGELDSWANTPRGTIALLILLDQFTRNMFRDSSKMFDGDAKALEIAQKAIANGTDKKVPIYQRAWIYIVLQRKEDVKVAEKSHELFVALHKEAEAKGKSKAYYDRALEVSQQQLNLIKKFGRFPNRNSVLGRQSTNEEVDYLTGDKKYFST